jgi:hypothetical protein
MLTLQLDVYTLLSSRWHSGLYELEGKVRQAMMQDEMLTCLDGEALP